MTSPALAAFQKRIGISFSNAQLLKQALTHKSVVTDPEANNEKLSSLGNKVLTLYAADFVDAKYPRLPKEAVESITEAYVGRQALYKISAHMGLLPVLQWNSGLASDTDEASRDKDLAVKSLRGKVPPFVPTKVHLESHQETVLCDDEVKLDRTGVVRVAAKSLSALVGAIYRDQGSSSARQFVQSTVLSGKVNVADYLDFPAPKQRLTQLLSSLKRERPISRILKETGRKSSHPIFIVGVFSGTEKLGEGAGSSLQMAENRAVRDALTKHFGAEDHSPRELQTVEV